MTVSIAIDGDFGVRTNQEESSQDQFLHAGGLSLAEPLTPAIQLLYQSGTLPKPIVAIETSLLSGSSVPDDIDAQLTFDATAGTIFNYDTTSQQVIHCGLRCRPTARRFPVVTTTTRSS